jgi:AcrR family transcriptional regulator
VAEAAGVSRALVHTYLGDRRGLIDAVQVQIISRLETWVGHGLARADAPATKLAAIVGGTFSFVDADREAWGVLGATGGLDHPALHGLRSRWATQLDGGGPDERLGAQAALGALLANVGTWVNRGVDPGAVDRTLRRLIEP